MHINILLENIGRILVVFSIVGLFALLVVCVMMVTAPKSYKEQEDQDNAQIEYLKEERKRKENKK